MANKLNELICFDQNDGNSGMPTCITEPGAQKAGGLIPKGRVLTRAEIAAIEATLQAGAIDDQRADRFHIIGEFVTVEASGEDRVQQTFANGRKRTIRRGKMGFTYTLVDGGKFYHSALMSFDDRSNQYDWLMIDENNKLIGTEKKDATGKPGLGGFALTDLYVSDYVMPNGTEGGSFTIGVELADSAQFNKHYAEVQLDFNPLTTITGLQTARLIDNTPSPGTTNHIVIGVNANGVNLSGTYGAALAVVPAWAVKNTLTGVAITVSAVAQTGDNYELTLATGGGNPGSGGDVDVTLKAPSVLKALTLPVEGIESNTITVELP